MKFTNKDIYIFDFDKSICTLDTDWEIWRTMCLSVIKKYDPSTDDDFVVKHSIQNDLFKKYGKEFKKDFDEQNKLFEVNQIKVCIPNTKILNLIESLEDKDLYIWSSNSRETVVKYLEELGILNKFKKIITREDVSFIKPEPEGFEYIKEGVPDKSKVIFIGDDTVDEKAASASGIDYFNVEAI